MTGSLDNGQIDDGGPCGFGQPPRPALIVGNTLSQIFHRDVACNVLLTPGKDVGSTNAASRDVASYVSTAMQISMAAKTNGADSLRAFTNLALSGADYCR